MKVKCISTIANLKFVNVLIYALFITDPLGKY